MLKLPPLFSESGVCLCDTTPDPDYYEKKLYTYPYHFLEIFLCFSCEIQSISSLSKTNYIINRGAKYSSLLNDSLFYNSEEIRQFSAILIVIKCSIASKGHWTGDL